jgi:site-specific recombinase XerD
LRTRPGADSEIRGAFKNACERASISDLHFHDLRHTFASHWMMAGGDLYVLKSILGHKSIVMTQRYAHLSPEFKRAAVDRMDNIWKVGAKPPTGARV